MTYIPPSYKVVDKEKVNLRLIRLLDIDNLYTEDEYLKNLQEVYYIKEEDVRKEYRYITNPEEFSSNLHSLVEYGRSIGKTGMPNFKDMLELEEALQNNRGLKESWVWDIYYYLVKDKNRFIQTINKYAFTIPVTILLGI